MKLPVFSEYFDEMCTASELPAFKFMSDGEELTVSRERFRSRVLKQTTTIAEKFGCGRRIALLGENSYDWITLYFAVVLSSNQAVLLDKDSSTAINKGRLTTAECRILLCSDTCMAAGTALMDSFETAEYSPELHAFSSILPSETEFIPLPMAPDDIATILFTSGTTGVSKAVPLTHENIISDSIEGSALTELKGVTLLVLPLHHGYGLVSAMLSPLYRGGTVFIGGGARRFISDLRQSKPDYIFAVPAMINMVVRSINRSGKGLDLRSIFGSNLKTVVCGSAPNPESMFHRFAKEGIELNCGYGITECSPMVSANRSGCVYPESVGVPLNSNEVKISDRGEILVKGKNVFKGYLNNDQANEAAFTPDGWFCTGDIGHFGENGELYVTGRIKNLIILSNGENISPEPLENAICELPYVEEALVCGENDTITAKVLLNDPGKKDDLRVAVKEINAGLPLNNRIGNVIICAEPLPKTSTGKILRSAN